MVTKKKSKYDKRWFGFVLGLVIPFVAIALFYLYNNSHTIDLFWRQIVSVNILSRVISLCGVPNLLTFFVFMKKDMLKAAYGVIGATFVYAFVVLILTNF
jgi:hypothetical protein